MSLYNLINGYNISNLLFLPMLGRKQEDYPRFRDCFLSEDGDTIIIYTRVGGNNRKCGFGEEELYKDENFIRTWDDDDCTYGFYEFKVPDKWRSDFDLIVSGNLKDVSDDYINYLKEFYPTISEQGSIDKLFKKEED